ncbi:hypothetical protein CCH79_00014876 [Gambusia affinis]|uniref:Uncharacterized protein n=1 Tax=Gambusia affinis TaxID=33528 RepID=A0A315VYP3_GAMAF|nr:hypothetical protein CCH79_00014876 [Gambusia affinis]
MYSSTRKRWEFVAQFKFTVLLMANGPLRITSSLFEPDVYQSEHEVEDPELKSSASRKAQKKKKKKASKTVENATGQAMETEAADNEIVGVCGVRFPQWWTVQTPVEVSPFSPLVPPGDTVSVIPWMVAQLLLGYNKSNFDLCAAQRYGCLAAIWSIMENLSPPSLVSVSACPAPPEQLKRIRRGAVHDRALRNRGE